MSIEIWLRNRGGSDLFGLRDWLGGIAVVEYGSGAEGVLLLFGGFLPDGEFLDRWFIRVLEDETMSAETGLRG